MRFPTQEVMACIREMDPGELIGLPRLTPEDAWRLDEFLERVHDLLWMDYGEEILAYQDSLDFLDLHPPEDAVAWTLPAPGSDHNIAF